MLSRVMKSSNHGEEPCAWVINLMVRSWLDVRMVEMGKIGYYKTQLFFFNGVFLDEEASISCNKNVTFVKVCSLGRLFMASHFF